MLYCEKCKKFMDAREECLFCGSKQIREPKENDVIYLTTQKFPYAGMLEEMLKENGIPCLIQGKFGAGLSMQFLNAWEKYKFFVPFGAYEKAKELVDDFFTE